MITVKTNINVVSQGLIKKLQVLRDPKPLLRPVAFDVVALMTQRIHEDGKAADDSQIGTYSKGYMAIRTGVFGNSSRVTRGMKTGQAKNAGVYTKGPHKGQARPRYNRTNDTKIVVSLTRQLENDWAVLAMDKGWGIGFHNAINAQKMKWVEEIKHKKIAALTRSEKDYAITKLKKLISEELKG